MYLIIINKKTKTFHLRVCKDNQKDNKYWIFTDKYNFLEASTEIGRIDSDILK